MIMAELVAVIVGLTLGASIFIYLFSALNIMQYIDTLRISAFGILGAWWSYLVNFYTNFWDWLTLGASFTNLYFTAFLIGVVAMVAVMLYNAIDTLTDEKKGNFSLIR